MEINNNISTINTNKEKSSITTYSNITGEDCIYAADEDLDYILDLYKISDNKLSKPPDTKQVETSDKTTSINNNFEESFNIYDYFEIYNQIFFEGKLGIIRLEWSKRMTLCAGVFSWKSTGDAVIRLSEPLLKFRSIDEVKETLLHEMIHAWVYVEKLDCSDDKGGHGYNFKFKMYDINKNTGLSITVFHSFHDEVDYYRKHVWRCNGVCKNKHPYYGYVRRAINRAPGKSDNWWEEHKKTCGGEFTKEEIKEDDKKRKENRNISVKVNIEVEKKLKKKVVKKGKGNKSENINNSNTGIVNTLDNFVNKAKK